ncbi:dihydrolipoamide acetyltransferase family protein [Sphingomonas kaistensis]|uniref:Dihydrolipoamide acetyltransferase component of pyruvate dehydrogenase complex n=1 Tax=Sphingomonas kaistensis TaxID=298708 RepID=A0ABZ2G335_9SPHN
MATYLFKLPDIGEGIAEAEIVAWHIAVGDRVEEDQQLADMMTDKATVEMESPVAGVVRKLAGEVGDQIAIGSVLVEIETEGADAAAAPAEAEEVPLADGAAVPTQAQEEANPTLDVEDAPELVRPERSAERIVEGRSPEPQQERASTSLSTNEDDRSHSGPILTTPAVRARARDLGIDLAQVKHQGEHIRHADLDAYLLYNGGQVSGRATALRADEQIKVVGLRRKIAENMQAAKRRIPHFALVEEYDVTALEETRAMMNRDRGQNPKLTLLPFLITALNKALADFPMINATYDDEANVITRHGGVHMGMAAQTPNGLMVPVIRNAERLSIWQLATEVARLSDAAKTGKATRDELSNPTFTISSLGPMGGVVSTPVISPPQVATVAVNKVEDKVVPVNGELEIRKRMNLSLSCDHRAVDGWDAASFLQALKPLIENPLRLLA